MTTATDIQIRKEKERTKLTSTSMAIEDGSSLWSPKRKLMISSATSLIYYMLLNSSFCVIHFEYYLISMGEIPLFASSGPTSVGAQVRNIASLSVFL